MKLPDSEQLDEQEYVFISDPWRQEWERGVQVPVNPDAVPNSSIRQIYDDSFKGSFKLNPRKFLHATQDANFQSGIHELTMIDHLAEQVTVWRKREEVIICAAASLAVNDSRALLNFFLFR
jgi:hypothetical protein